jgi:chromosomal replication initiation ATPase DnaA
MQELSPFLVSCKKEAEQKTCDQLGVTPEIINDPRRNHEAAHARFLVWSILRDEFDLSYVQIGRIYDKDHTSIIYGVQQSRFLFNHLNEKSEVAAGAMA